ncbi:MAG: sigma-70 family RNA polymerase sigma factor [bacterium JZ-2024 1]
MERRETNDENLVQWTLEGDISAFEDLIMKYQDAVYHYLCFMTQNEARAQDLLQETVIRAFEGLRSLRHPSRFKAWLFQIATNVFRSEYRRSARALFVSLNEPRLSPEDLALGEEQNLPTPEEAAEREDIREQVQEALAKLPPVLREAVILREMENMSYEEIAEMLGIPIGTVRSRIARGRALLVKWLGAEKSK